MPDPQVRLHAGRVREPVRLPARPGWLVGRIESADLSAGTWVALCGQIGLAPVAAVVAGVMWSTVVSVAVAVVMCLVPLGVLAHRQGRRDRRLVAGLPGRLDLIARGLRTGHTLRQGIAMAGTDDAEPIGETFRAVDKAIERGLPMTEAFTQLSASTTSPDMAAMVGLLSVVAEGAHGGASAIEAGSEALRQRASVREEVRALIAQAETSLRVVVALPFVFVGLGLLSGQSGALALFATSTGRMCLVLGLGLEAIGVLWMNVLVNRALR